MPAMRRDEASPIAPIRTTDAAAPATADPVAPAAEPNATTITATSSPSSATPLNERNQPVQSNPWATSSSTSSSPKPADQPSRETRRIPFRSHPELNARSSDPTTRRSGSSARPSSATPSAAITTAISTNPAAAPRSDARQDRVTPTATTMATISITSIVAARKVEAKTPQFTGPHSCELRRRRPSSPPHLRQSRARRGPLEEPKEQPVERLGLLQRREVPRPGHRRWSGTSKPLRQLLGAEPEIRQLELAGRDERGRLELDQPVGIHLGRCGHLDRLGRGDLHLEGAALHRRDAVAESLRGVGKSPGVDYGGDSGLDVASLQGRLLGLPGGLELARRLEPGRAGGHQDQRRDPLRSHHRDVKRDRAAERVAHHRRAVDLQVVNGLQHIRPWLKLL